MSNFILRDDKEGKRLVNVSVDDSKDMEVKDFISTFTGHELDEPGININNGYASLTAFKRFAQIKRLKYAILKDID